MVQPSLHTLHTHTQMHTVVRPVISAAGLFQTITVGDGANSRGDALPDLFGQRCQTQLMQVKKAHFNTASLQNTPW